MEFQTTSPLFKNAAMRNQFLRDVMEAFEACHGHAELICVYQEFEPTFDKMKVGGEYDVIALEIIQARYRGLHVRHEQDQERIRRALEHYDELGY